MVTARSAAANGTSEKLECDCREYKAVMQ